MTRSPIVSLSGPKTSRIMNHTQRPVPELKKMTQAFRCRQMRRRPLKGTQRQRNRLCRQMQRLKGRKSVRFKRQLLGDQKILDRISLNQAQTSIKYKTHCPHLALKYLLEPLIREVNSCPSVRVLKYLTKKVICPTEALRRNLERLPARPR